MITIVIPTKNRSDFLIRALQYYADVECKYKIIIGDSSDALHRERLERVIKSLQRKLWIDYKYCPDIPLSVVLQQLSQAVTTPFIVQIPDDDFLVPRSMDICARFLEKHSEYSSAHGIAAVTTLKELGPYGYLQGAVLYRQSMQEEDSAAMRLLNYLSNYEAVLFSIHRTRLWQEMFQNIGCKITTLATEILPSCLSVINGKVKQLDCLYLVRQEHNQRYLFPTTPYDLIISANWPSSYEIFRNRLTKGIMRQDGISASDAEAIVKQAFWFYLNKILIKGFGLNFQQYCQIPQSSDMSKRVGDVIKSIPGTMYLRRIIQSFKVNDISLPSLLNPRSPYHNDFMPVYRAITIPPDEAP